MDVVDTLSQARFGERYRFTRKGKNQGKWGTVLAAARFKMSMNYFSLSRSRPDGKAWSVKRGLMRGVFLLLALYASLHWRLVRVRLTEI